MVIRASSQLYDGEDIGGGMGGGGGVILFLHLENIPRDVLSLSCLFCWIFICFLVSSLGSVTSSSLSTLSSCLTWRMLS